MCNPQGKRESKLSSASQHVKECTRLVPTVYSIVAPGKLVFFASWLVRCLGEYMYIYGATGSSCRNDVVSIFGSIELQKKRRFPKWVPAVPRPSRLASVLCATIAQIATTYPQASWINHGISYTTSPSPSILRLSFGPTTLLKFLRR